MKFVVPLMKSDVPNKNGRIYPGSVLSDVVRQFDNMDVPMLGQMGYPDGGVISLSNVTHTINKVWFKVQPGYRLPRKTKKKINKSFGKNAYKLWKNNRPKELFGEIEIIPDKVELVKNFIGDVVFRSVGIGSERSDGNVWDYEITSFSMSPKSEDSWQGVISNLDFLQ